MEVKISRKGYRTLTSVFVTNISENYDSFTIVQQKKNVILFSKKMYKSEKKINKIKDIKTCSFLMMSLRQLVLLLISSLFSFVIIFLLFHNRNFRLFYQYLSLVLGFICLALLLVVLGLGKAIEIIDYQEKRYYIPVRAYVFSKETNQEHSLYELLDKYR